MKHLRLRYQIALATFLPLVVFALLAGGVGAHALRRIPEDLVLGRQAALAQVAAAGVAGSLRGDVRLLETTAAELAAHADDVERQQEIVRERSRALSIFTAGATLLDADGTAIAATPAAEAALGHSFADRAYFQEVRASLSPVFSTAFQDLPAGDTAVVIAVPVWEGGAFAGAFLGRLSLSRPDWARDLNLLRTPQGGKAYLIDGASTIIYHPDAERVGASIQSDPDLWRLVIGGEPRSLLYQPPGSGQLTVVSYAPIPGVALGLILEEPWEAILAAIIPYEWAVAGLMGAGIIVALVALVLSVNRVTRPLDALVAAGQRVAEGKPYAKLAVAGPPDLRTLTGVINQMVAHLAEQQAALRRYALQVVQSQEDERLRVSRDLHDETIQELIALAQRIELCADALDEDPAAAKARLREAQGLAQKALAGVRRISHNLRPSTLEDLGLAAALQVLVRELGEQLPSARVQCEVLGREARLPSELELAAFRIVQEALSNVRKHAKAATRVNVALVFEAWGVLLMVEDDGSGFEVADRDALVQAGHLGLAGMAERVQLFGGELSVVSAPGEGTTVSVRLPLAAGPGSGS